MKQTIIILIAAVCLSVTSNAANRTTAHNNHDNPCGCKHEMNGQKPPHPDGKKGKHKHKHLFKKKHGDCHKGQHPMPPPPPAQPE